MVQQRVPGKLNPWVEGQPIPSLTHQPGLHVVQTLQFTLVLFQTLQQNWDDEERPLQFEDHNSRPDDMYRRRYLRESVEAAISKLPEHHRQVFVLRELEGKPYEEIADITGCNLGTVKSRLNRARAAFAAIIEPAIA